MSVQVGIWNFDGRPVDRTLIENYSRRLAKYAPDGESTFFDGSIAMLYRPFHTTSNSRLERQPHASAAGNIITWDGRLDNREELAAQLMDRPSIMITDVEVVAAAFDLWGSECFAKFIGDWAFAGWDPKKKTLTLAIDYMAIKHLHYYLKGESITWSTDLEALVLESGDKFDPDDVYIAGFLICDPSHGHTPYCQIKSVKPGHFVQIHGAYATSSAYFVFHPTVKLRYRTDVEYEEHFRHLFRQSVKRRLCSDVPILADLSGGLDSSAIVCMADDIIAKSGTDTPCPYLDTYSHYDLGEPDGDDLQYLSIVERHRGRVGHHLNIAQYRKAIVPAGDSFLVAPNSSRGIPEMERALENIWRSGGYRVRLCGVGGDEMLGGIPNPCPELADLFICGRLFRFFRQTTAWSLHSRRPWLHLAFNSICLLAPAFMRGFLKNNAPLDSWIDPHFSLRCQLNLRQLGPIGRHGYWLPSRQSSARAVIAMSGVIANDFQRIWPVEETRFPYLDQSLVEFVLSIPREQVIRPGQRRSLMRRALKGVLPDAIISRRTKGTVVRRSMLAIERDWQILNDILKSSLAAQYGYVDEKRFRASILDARNGNAPHFVRLLRGLTIEFWLQAAVRHGLIRLPHEPLSHEEGQSPVGSRLPRLASRGNTNTESAIALAIGQYRNPHQTQKKNFHRDY